MVFNVHSTVISERVRGRCLVFNTQSTMMVISLSQVNGVACVCERVVIWTSENMRCWCNILLYNFIFLWQTMPFPQWINKVILYLVEKSELRSCVKVEVDVLGSPSLIVCTLCGHKATLNSSYCRRY